jgi:DNA-binding MarR family transcriptional regulator
VSAAAPSEDVPVTTTRSPWLHIQADGQGLDLENFPTFLLVRLVHSLQRKITRSYLEPHELTVPDWRVLSFVQRYGPARFSDLSARVSLDKAQVSRTVKHLRSRGLISVTTDPDHAQRVILLCTSDGRKMHGRILPVARKAQAQLLLAMDEPQRGVFFAALHKLQSFADGLPDCAPSPSSSISGARN